MPPRQGNKGKSVFLNIPYDPKFHKLCLAYISGVVCFGLAPRATVEVPGSARRLDRIIELIGSCAFSIHDLSRVELDRNLPRTPRFNMPFEIGLTVAWQKLGDKGHMWFAFESQPYRLAKSLSDLSGTDVYIHGGTVEGVLRQLCHAFVREKRQPSLPQMLTVYRHINKELPRILRASGAEFAFEGARAFRDVCIAAALKAEARTQ